MAENVELKRLDGLKDAAKHARLPFERDWWLNVAFYVGEQYTEWAPEVSNIRRIPRTKKTRSMPRPVVNKINHFVNQQHAFALQNKPTADVIPATDSIIDQSDAQVALAYCNYVASNEVSGFPRNLSRATLWALVCGEAYLKWCWDPKRKRPMIIVCSPFDIYVDPYATDWQSVRYVIHSKFFDREQVRDSYGKDIKSSPEKADEMRARLLREMGQSSVLEGVTVNEIWMRPNSRHPQGMYAVWAGKEWLVAPQPLPYEYLGKHDRLPFTQIGVIPRPGSCHYDSHVKYLRSPQMELNKYHAQRIQIRENYANPKWWIPSELQLEDDPDNSPNQVLRGHSDSTGIKPEIIQASQMGDNNEGEWLKAEMMDTVGLHEVSQAQVPGRVESAKAIELLKEADATRLSELSATISEAIGEGYWQVVNLAQQFEKESLMVQVYSPEGVPEVKDFRARALAPGVRFHVTMGTGLAWSRAARVDQLLNLWDRGVMQQDPVRFLELMDIPAPFDLAVAHKDVRLARNENRTIAKQQAITPNSWDNHEIHLREHNEYRKTQEYVLLDEGAKSRFEYHCTTHEELWLQQLNKEAVLIAAKNGAMLEGGGEEGEEEGAPPPQSGGPQGGQQTQPAAEPSE